MRYPNELAVPDASTGPNTAKELSTLQAAFALEGWALDPAPTEAEPAALQACRWGRCRLLSDVAAARSLLALIQGAAHV